MPFLKMKKGDFILALVLIAIFAGSLVLTFMMRNGGGSIAEISIDGEAVRRIDLSSVDGEQTFRIEQEDGRYNTIQVAPGRIRVIDASCPDKVDVKQGWISDGTRQIVCLPNRLVIRIIKESKGSGEKGGGLFGEKVGEGERGENGGSSGVDGVSY